MHIYVKTTSNCPEGMQLTVFQELSETWAGEQVVIPFGDDEDKRTLPVVGWSDLFGGSHCPVRVVKATEPNGATGYLVYGGNSGVRVMDDEAAVEEWNAHLPPGYGLPVVWVENADDLPDDVRAVVG